MQIRNYRVTDEPLHDTYKSSPEELRFIEEYNEKLIKRKNIGDDTIGRIKNFIERFPLNPTLKNYLGIAYQKAGMTDEYNALLDEITEKHPDYLFGRIMNAVAKLKDGNPEEAAELMGGFTNIGLMYPHRKVFHQTELKGYESTAIQYYVFMDDVEEAAERLKYLKSIGIPTNELKGIAETAEDYKMLAILRGLKQRTKEDEAKGYKKIEGFLRDKYEQTEVEPTFQNKVIDELYFNDYDISNQLIERILACPRESLITDLEIVVKDSIQRYQYFSEKYEDIAPEHTYFLHHALILLGELKAFDSLDVVLEPLRQGYHFNEFWFGDYNGIMLRTVLILSRNQLDVLKEFMLESDNDSFNRGLISDVVSTVGIAEPNRLEEVLIWFKEVLDLLWENKENKSILDSYVLASIISDIIDLHAADILHTHAKRFFDTGLVDETISGNWDDHLKELQYPNTFRAIPIESIYELYKEIREENIPDTYKEVTYNPVRQAEIRKDMEEKKVDSKIKNFMTPLYELAFGKEMPQKSLFPSNRNIPLPSPNIGRNDPCYCGSGKKYKKCHGA
jgi:hypothetical protein